MCVCVCVCVCVYMCRLLHCAVCDMLTQQNPITAEAKANLFPINQSVRLLFWHQAFRGIIDVSDSVSVHHMNYLTEIAVCSSYELTAIHNLLNENSLLYLGIIYLLSFVRSPLFILISILTFKTIARNLVVNIKSIKQRVTLEFGRYIVAISFYELCRMDGVAMET